MPAVKRLASFLIIITFFIWAGFYISNNIELFKKVGDVPFLYVVLLAISYCLMSLSQSELNRTALGSYAIDINRSDSFFLVIAGSFFNYFLPGRGGALIRAAYLKKYHLVTYSRFASIFIVINAINFVTSILIGLAGFSFYLFYENEIIFICVPILMGLSVFAIPFLLNLLQESKISLIARLAGDLGDLVSNKPRLAILALFSIVYVAISCIQVYFAFAAISIEMPIQDVLIYTSVKGLAAGISITPGALGIVETALLAMGNILGYTLSDILIVQGLTRTVSLATTLLFVPAFFYMFEGVWRKASG